jgi:hypothetical protein
MSESAPLDHLGVVTQSQLRLVEFLESLEAELFEVGDLDRP